MKPNPVDTPQPWSLAPWLWAMFILVGLPILAGAAEHFLFH